MSENDISAGAFRRAFTLNFERNVAFPKEIIAFMVSEATATYVASREGKGSRARIFEVDFLTKTLAGYSFFEIRFSDVGENTTIIML